MRGALFCLLLVPFVLQAQDAKRFQRALNARIEHRLDHWVKREIHRQREGQLIPTPSGSYRSHAPTFDSLVAFLRRQPGVEDAAWDRCMGKLDIWPGHSTIGMRWHARGQVIERCWGVQEGIPGALKLPGWRPHVRKDRQNLKCRWAKECLGFVEQEVRRCEELAR